MKVTVTHLKAPWPAGAVIGSVVDLQFEALPGWATGKCALAPDDAEAQFVVDAGPAPVLTAEQQLEAMRKRAVDAEAALAAKSAELDAAAAQLAETAQKLVDAEAALAAKGKKG